MRSELLHKESSMTDAEKENGWIDRQTDGQMCWRDFVHILIEKKQKIIVVTPGRCAAEAPSRLRTVPVPFPEHVRSRCRFFVFLRRQLMRPCMGQSPLHVAWDRAADCLRVKTALNVALCRLVSCTWCWSWLQLRTCNSTEPTTLAEWTETQHGIVLHINSSGSLSGLFFCARREPQQREIMSSDSSEFDRK